MYFTATFTLGQAGHGLREACRNRA